MHPLPAWTVTAVSYGSPDAHRLATGLDDAGTDEVAALAEPAVPRMRGVVLEVAEGGLRLVFLDTCADWRHA